MTASSPGLLALLSLSPDLAAGLGVALGLLVGAAAAGWVVRTRERRARAAVEASDALHRRLFDEAADVMLLHDTDGGALRVNAAGRAVLCVATDTPSLSLLDAVAVADRAMLRRHLAALEADGQARSDIRVSGPSGDPILLDLASRLVGEDGARRAVSVGRDVGARRAREAALVAARDEAEEAARVRSQFLASMSHEIRTPLTSVVGFTEILRDEVEESQRGLVDAIAAGGQRLLSTLDSVLDLATLDARRETLRPASLDVVAAVESAIEQARPQAEAQGLTLTVEPLAASLPATLDADALGRILAHLVGNAVRYTEVGSVTVEVDADADAVAIRVIDTGIGIPEAAMATLFDGFKSPGQGQGFGLAITQRLVHLMGGTVSVESRWRAGTAVTVVLPRGDATPTEAPQTAEALA